jgi:hypothetical protein
MGWVQATKAESDYFESLEAEEVLSHKAEYASQFDGSYEAGRGDYEGAILARDEFNSGRIS